MAAKKPNYYIVNLAGHKEPAIVKAYTRNQSVLHVAGLTITARLADPGDMIGISPASIIDATIEPAKPEPSDPAAVDTAKSPDPALAAVVAVTQEPVTVTGPASVVVVGTHDAPAIAVTPAAAVAPQADPALATADAGTGNAETDTIALASDMAADSAFAGENDEDPADAAVANEPPAPQAQPLADPAPVGTPLDGGTVAAIGLPSWMK